MRRSLLLHPDCRCAAVERIEADIVRSAPTGLTVQYFVTGDIRALKLPLPAGAGRADELWRHTCFELFLRAPEEDSYCEFNFAPSLQWAAYRFDGYRSGMQNLGVGAPRIAIRQEKTSLELQAALALDGVADSETDWNFALCTVIEETSGNRSYWALAHPAGKPDFHYADAFALSLPAQIM